MLAAYAMELHALKTELQSTLARLGIDPVRSDDVGTAETAEARRNSRRSRRSDTTRSITRWNRRQLTRELAAAAERRRELEMQLQRDMRRQENDTQEQERRTRHTNAYQDAITALQQQRQEILRQMERDTTVEETQEQEEGTQQNRQNQGFPMRNNEVVSETHYSIGGVVTLEPLSSSQQLQVSTSRGRVSFQPVAAPAPAAVPAPVVTSGPVPVSTTIPSVLDPHQRYRNTPDALNDVFLLQLKFAETMLKLEKSVQMRDQLLHHGGSLPKQWTTQSREESGRVRRHGRQLQRRRRSESGSNSDSSVMMYRENHSSESFSSSAYSFSSLDSTPHRCQTIRVRYPNFGVSRATTAETLAPSSSSTDGSRDNGAAAPVSSKTATTLSPQEISNTFGETAEHRRTSDSNREPSDEANHRTPTTDSSVTTPTTGSDQKSAASSSKQVRFGDDAYSTPIIARKFNFDGPSIDEDDDEEKHEEVESVLSFLGGSSVTSAELNDASFLRAFERFRHELQLSRHDTVFKSPSQPPLARKLFPPPSVSLPPSSPKEVEDTTQCIPEKPHDNKVGSTTQLKGHDNAEMFPALSGLSIEELQERRRQLCLDIQAESAHLVLSLSSFGAQDGEQTKNRLLELRDELKAVDARLCTL